MFENILEKFLEWFASQSIYVDFLSRLPEPLCDPIFSAALFTVFFCVSVSIVKGSISSWNFNRKMKKKARELEEMRANERLEDVRREKERKMERDAEINSRKEMKDMMEQYLKFMALVNAQNSVGQMMSLKNMSFEQWQTQMYKRQPDVIFVPPAEEVIEVKKPKNNIVYIDNVLENESNIVDDNEFLSQKAEEEARLEAEKVELARKEAERKQAEELARIEAEKERQRLEEERREAERVAELERIARKQAEDKARAEEEARIKAEEEARLKAEEVAKRKAFEEEQARIKAENEQRAREEAMAEAERIAKEEADRKAEEARLEAERLAEVERIEAEFEAENDDALLKEKEEVDTEVVSTSFVPETVPDEVDTSSLELTDEQESDFAKLVAMMANDEKQKGQIFSYNQKKSEVRKKNIEALDSQIASSIEDKKDTKVKKSSDDDVLEQQKKEALARLEAEKSQQKKEKFSLFKKK